MKARKMWAEMDWEIGCGAGLWKSDPHFEDNPGKCRVLVIDAEGMPDLEPGDRVRGHITGDEYTLVGYPYPHCGFWALQVDTGGYVRADEVTKLPREKTVTLKVTGPEDEVDKTAEQLAGIHSSQSRGVRVERVDP